MATVKSRSLFQLWRDVIFALILRHLVSKFNDKFGVGWLIIQPVSFILILSALRGKMSGGDLHGLPPFLFMLFGFLAVIQFIQGWSTVAGSIQKDKPLYAFRQVQPISSVITVIIVEFIAYLMILTVLAVIAVLFNLGSKLDDPLFLILYSIEIQIIGYFIGLFFSVLRLYVKEVMKIESLLQRPLIFISGAFFSLNDIPKDMWVYLTWNPLVHGIELSRHAVKNQFPLVNAVDETYFHSFTLCILFLSLATYTAFWKKGIAR